MSEPQPGKISEVTKTRLRWLALALFCVALVAVRALGDAKDDRMIRAMAPDERAALYARTVENLRSSCAPGVEPVRWAWCEEQAKLAAKFPECDAACMALVRVYVPHPTR